MRTQKTYSGKNVKKGRGLNVITKIALFVLLFSLVFSCLLISVNNFNFANAAATQTGEATTVSSTTSTNIASKYNSNQSNYLKHFFIDSESADSTQNFKWWERGYGWQNYAFGDKALVYWLEFKFDGELLAAAKEGRVSYYASAKSTFSGDLIESTDENAMAVSYIGTNNAPTEAVVSSSRSGNSASWASTSDFNSFTDWKNDSVTHTLGNNKFDTTYVSKSTTTGIRLIFAVIGDGDLHGGFSNLNLTLYVKPKDLIESSGTTFSLTDGLYGDQYTINATNTSNFGSISKVAAQSSAEDLATPQKVVFTKGSDIKYTGSGNDIISMGVATSSYDLAGIFVNLRDGNGGDRTGKTVPFDDEQFATSAKGPFINCYTDFTITLPPGVTAIDFSAYLYAGSSHDASSEADRASATVELITSSTVRGSAVKDTTAKTGKTAHVAKGAVTISNCVVNSTASTKNTTLTVRLRLKAAHENWDTFPGSGDNGTAYALLGNIKIKMYGQYSVKYNPNGASGSASTQNFRFGIKDANEILKSAANCNFTYANHTFVGWALSSDGNVKYALPWDTSSEASADVGEKYTDWTKELTSKPGETVNLYAVWYDSDFGKLTSGTSGKWGSSTNPYVISSRDHWLSLVDIVNGNRDPVDSVVGTYYGNTISSDDVESQYTSFAKSYFIVTKDLDLGNVEPIGKDNGTSYKSKNFQGVIYGGSAVNVKTNRKISVDIDTDYSSETTRGTGLFGNYVGYLSNGITSIEYLTVTGTISSTIGKVGGIVGVAAGTYAKSIVNCISQVNIKSFTLNSLGQIDSIKEGAGGIVGYVNAGTTNLNITNCKYSGGSAMSFTRLKDNVTSTLTGNIIGSNGTAGILGYMASGENKMKITGCSSSGTIYGEPNVGGIAGRVETKSTAVDSIVISNVYNSAKVVVNGSTYTVGGIVGYFYYNGTSTTNRVLNLQQAYNIGAVESGGQNAGGIIGSATTNSTGQAANVVLNYCYNNTTSIKGTAATTNAIVGAGTNTVSNSWSFSTQTGSTAQFGASNHVGISNTSAKGKFVSVAMSGAKILPSTTTATNTSSPYNSWENITTSDFTYFRVTSSIANEKYLRIYNPDSSNALIAPYNSNFVKNASSYASTYNVVFASSNSNKKIAIELADVKRVKNSDNKTYDGECAPDVTNWIAVADNPYCNKVEVEYSADGVTWLKDTEVFDVAMDGSAVKAYTVKLTLYNGANVIGVNYVGDAYTIKRRSISFAYDWTSGWLTGSTTYTKNYIYNAQVRRLNGLTVTGSGIVARDTIDKIFALDTANSNVEIEFDGIKIIVKTDTVNYGDYRLKLNHINTNYSIGTLYLDWKWTIQRKSIDNTHFGEEEFDVLFGYDGIASGAHTFTNGGLLHALDMLSDKVFYKDGDSPYALVYKDDNTNKYININNYNLYYLANVDTMVRDRDYTLTISGGTINGNSFAFDGGQAVEVTLTYTGIGNYTDTRTVRFTLMESDFGGNFDQADWGSESNPYLIQNNAHLARLGQIVAGAPAWNSINNADNAIAYVANANAKATARTYSGTYFFLTSNVNASTNGGFISIGKDGNYPFSATFNGKYNSTDYTVTLAIDESEANINYTGLFGYLHNATVSNITTLGKVKGVDYVGGIAGYANLNTRFTGTMTNGASVEGRNFVGGIGGEIACTLTGASNEETATVSGMRAVGGIVGYLTGSVISSSNKGSVKYVVDLSEYNDGLFIGDGGISFNGIGGIVGFINTNGAKIEDCVNYDTAKIVASGAYGVGGIVGYANVNNGFATVNATTARATENRASVTGLSYVGGIVGYARSLKINENCAVSANVTGSGADALYTGGIAGKWVVTDKAQMEGQRKVDSSITIDGMTYVGGLVGWLDAREASGLKLNPYITNGTSTPIAVKGKSYVGALYGGFEGYGYKRTSASASDSDTLIYIDPSSAEISNNPYIYVDITLKTGGRVAGGLFGYISGAGIMFLGDWLGTQHTPVTFAGGSSHSTDFFGGIAGVIGANATLESAKREQGDIVICLVPHTVTYRATSAATALINKGDFVGSIAGFVASTAGVYISSDTTLMGNYIQLYNDSEITAKSYVGGIFGAIGKDVNYVVNGDINLQNLVRYGSFGSEATGPNNTLRYAPIDDGGLGKLFNLRPIIGSGDYVGGIVGYVGDGALIAFVNPSVDGNTSGFSLGNARTFLNVYNGYGLNPTDGDTATIRGANYVGGIAGYVSAMSHELLHAVSLMRVMASSDGSSENGNYAGGIFGYMGGGSVLDSIATSGYSSTSTSVNAFMGNEYVGGIVGMLGGGKISGSVSRGFKFTSVSLTKGGIAGSVNAGASVDASWTFYLATNPTYATVSQNNNGNYVIVDSSVVSGRSPRFSEYARMVGLFTLTGNATVDENTIITRASDEKINQAKAGYLSISSTLPKQNSQLVFYDASGNDVAAPNQFETIAYQNSIVYYRFDMATTASFSICVREIEFSDIKQYTGSDEATKKKYVSEAYVQPSANNLYNVELTSTPVFDGGFIKTAIGNAIYPGRNPSATVILGTFNKTFTVGDSSTPYVITTQSEWNTFAQNIRDNATVNGAKINGYYGKYIKLAPTEPIKITSSNLAGVRTATTSSSNNVFKGTFDGDGNTLTINVSSSTAADLSGMSVFPGAAGAKFQNLTIAGNITATGAALNYVSDTDSENAANIGGFVGKPLGNLTFENCTNLTNITAQRTAGGIVGFTNGYTINLTACVNGKPGHSDLGKIESTDRLVDDFINYNYGTGGIIGYATNTITIESCKNEGNIRGAYNVGGIMGQNSKATNIYNCANNGEILGDAFWKDEEEYAAKSEGGTYRLVYAGGILGQVGPEGYLNMLACYNSGTVSGFGPIEGGLVGSVGRLMMESSWDADKGVAGGKSVIAYCYNSGAVNSAGTRRLTTNSGEHMSNWWHGGREELNGSIVGGIVGFIAWGDVNYCYNTGKISTYRIIGYAGTWQTRIGGIAGQAQPTESNYKVDFKYCYNLGELYTNCYQYGAVAGWARGDAYWGGGICGYLDKGNDKSRLSSSNCYTIANYNHFIEHGRGVDKWGSQSINTVDNDDLDRYVIGSIVNSVDQLTTYMSATGKLTVDKPIKGSSDIATNDQAATLIDSSGKSVATYANGKVNYTNTAYINGTAYGYIYIYGCLPQLAVFALDTKEGLSMLSVSYGRNEYGKFVGNQAGSKESPYVIKDGVGLLAMSALNGAKSGSSYYNFKGKYIEFADGTNNIEELNASYINMNMTTSTNSLKSGDTATFDQSGKNYFLYSLGAASGQTTARYGASPQTAAIIRSYWYEKNHYYSGSSNTDSATGSSSGLTRGGAFNNFANFYPIGNGSIPFAGNISGLQGENKNTEIRGLRISQRTASNSYAGLFGAVYDATISNITVSASNVFAYSTSDSSQAKTFAGGIVGYAGGNSRILYCQAGSSANELKVTAYAHNTTVTNPSTEGYAGGIVGVAGPSMPNVTTAELKTLEISNSRTARATVSSASRYIGGIVGYVGNPWASASSGRGNYVNISDVYVYNSEITALASTSTTPNAGTDTGGIVGTNDGNTILTINGANVGVKHPFDATSSTLTVNIYGEHSFGGVIGTANGNTAIGNINVSNSTSITRKAWGNAVNYPSGLYHTAIGGVVGKTITGTTNTLLDKITFNGTINVHVQNTSSTDKTPTGNIGGIIGAMSSGTRFLSGSVIKATGTINSNLTEKAFIRNIGGIAGATLDGAFDGTFDVSPKINAPNATNVGGFIGRNLGIANILASDSGTTVTINANIAGKSQVGGLVGLNGYGSAGTLQIGADTYLGGRFEGQVTVTVASTAKITASGDDAGGLFGSNTADGAGQGVVITKGVLHTAGTVSGYNNVGGIVGNNQGNITMGGSSVAGARLEIQNSGTVVGGRYTNGTYAGDGDNVGGVIGYLQKGTIAGRFGNTGSVSGHMFVGGSIGRVDKDALLTASNEDTYFYNGAYGTADDGTSGADTSVGNVSGVMYVGGSIGGMLGKVEGAGQFVVRFINEGEVNGSNFMGGNIGLLAGTVNNAQFTNSGRVNADGTNAIGGSVGFVGITTLYDAEKYEHQNISIKNTHFEFIGENNIVVSGTVQSSEDELNQGGVGGAIGVIGNASNDFDNDGSLWQNVTLYTASGVNASNVVNVGGAIGLIKANNIVISNMLAFYTTVSGKKNVGGIVGAVSGYNIKVLDSFNIEGTVSGTTAGGIIGLAVTSGMGVTVANTSYWVKGFVNAELMALDLDTVVHTLGRYVAVSDGKNVFTEELTTAYGSPAHYTGKDSDGTEPSDWAAYLKRISGKDVTLANGVWAYAQDANGYTTGEASTGWYYVYANDRAGLDTTHISAANNQRPSILAQNERELELKYWKRIAKAYTAEDMMPDKNGVIAATEELTSPIAANVNGTTVTGGGAPESGHIYAAALESQVSGYYLYMDASGVKPNIYYGEQTDWNSTGVMRKPFYLDAKTSLNGDDDMNAQNVAIYYRSVGVGGTLTYNGYQRYVPITDEVGKTGAESSVQLIKYLSSEDMLEEGNIGDYVYTMTNVKKNGVAVGEHEVVEAGSYHMDVTIYFYDTLGKYGKIGGFEQSELRIETLGIANDLTPDNGEYNGDDTTGSITLNLHGIAPLDNGVNMLNGVVRSVKFNIRGEQTTAINGTLDIGALMAALGTANSLGTKSFGTSAADRAESKKLMPFASDKIYLSEYTVSLISENKLKDTHWDTKCIIDDRYNENVRPFSITVKFRFTETVEDTFIISIDDKDISRNYNAEELKEQFAITPRLLELKRSNGSFSSHKFDGARHSTQYEFVGWVENQHTGAEKTALIQSLLPYITGAGYGDVETSSWNNIVSPYTLKQGNSLYVTATWIPNSSNIALSDMRYVGEYDIKFATTSTYKIGNEEYILTEGGNYYVKLPEDALYQIMENSLRMSWSADNKSTYDAQYRWFTAEFVSEDDAPFDTADLLAEEIATLFPAGYDKDSFRVIPVDSSTVKVEFRVGPNAGTHTVVLPDGDNAHTENCAIENPMAGAYTIEKLAIAIGLSGNDEVSYNGGFHRATGISANCTTNPNAAPQWSFNNSDGVYTLTMFASTAIQNELADNSVRVRLTYNGSMAAVNAGTYTAQVLQSNISYQSAARNFNITANGQGTLTIKPAKLTLEWTNTSAFTYDKAWHGRGLQGTLSNYGSGMRPGSFVYAPSQTNSTAKMNVTNAVNKTETFTIPVSGTHAAVDASADAYVAKVDLNKITISGTNATNATTLLSNYEIVFDDANNGSYKINKRQISVSNISGNTTSKVYDATTDVVGTIGTPQFSGTVLPNQIKITAVYDSPNVGTNKTIIYTITLLGTDANNFMFDGGVAYTTYEYKAPRVEITARQLIIRLDRLRNSFATKTYDGTVWYGGIAGARSLSGKVTATSAIHRSGEGFTVYEIAEGESTEGAVVVTAMYREAIKERSRFDSYVNNVVVNGAEIAIGSSKYGEDGYSYKDLVFALDGPSAENYKFIVCLAGDSTNLGDAEGDVNNEVTVSGETSGVKIMINPYTVKADYKYTAQSYATADNSYNTNWHNVEGSAKGVNNQTLSVAVVNNWKYQNNNPTTAIPAIFKSYTVIRGAEGSRVLSAKLANSEDGAQVNYRLSNQPVLTIGYFVDKDEFEIGSMASLMIATYYYAVSRGVYDEFGIVISQASWNLVVSAEDYENGTGNLPSSVTDSEGNVIEINSWDDYFAWLASDAGGNHEIFLNQSEENSGWGYYSVDPDSIKQQSYDKFKQIANVSGVLTQQDIAILNGMFNKVTIDSDGNIVEDESYTWGVGGNYLTNFLKLSEGNVATAIGSIFGGEFVGQYNGNGYTIDGVNIIGVASNSTNRFGMFESVTSGQIQNIHLRNFNVNVNASGETYIGAIAGEISQEQTLQNVSVHATITANVNGRVYAGGMFGVSSTPIDRAIVLGDMNITATRATVGGAVGENRGAEVATNNTVSLMQIWVSASTNEVGGIVGSETSKAPVGVYEFMQNSVWSNGSVVAGGRAYSDLFNGSISGYAQSKYYYTGEQGNEKGIYDVLDDVKLTRMDGEDNTRTNARESMRLADIIDIYVLMYSKSATTTNVEGVSVAVFEKSQYSWLVGTTHGTTKDGDAIQIANQQGVALLRELRFASFILKNDVKMYSTYILQTARGAFYGSVNANGHAIYIATWDGVQTMFDIEIGASTPTSVLKAK